jgi:ribosomal protein L12E/L44/L45/RPP1/RPP2
MAVIERYGLMNYGGVEINEQRAKALIKAFGLQNVEETFV